jgi:hypothetical protein
MIKMPNKDYEIKNLINLLTRGLKSNNNNNQYLTQPEQIQSVFKSPDNIFTFANPTKQAILSAVENTLLSNIDEDEKLEFIKKIKNMYDKTDTNKEYKDIVIKSFKINPSVILNPEIMPNLSKLVRSNDEFQLAILTDFDKHPNRIIEIQEKFHKSLQLDELKYLSLLAKMVNMDFTQSNQIYKEFFSTYKIDTVQHFFEAKQQENFLFEKIHNSFNDNSYPIKLNLLKSLYFKTNLESITNSRKQQTEIVTGVVHNGLQNVTQENNIKELMEQFHVIHKFYPDVFKNQDLKKEYASIIKENYMLNLDNYDYQNEVAMLSAIKEFKDLELDTGSFIDDDLLKKVIDGTGYKDTYGLGSQHYPLVNLQEMGIKINESVANYAIAKNNINAIAIGFNNMTDFQKSILLNSENHHFMTEIKILTSDYFTSYEATKLKARTFLLEVEQNSDVKIQLIKKNPINIKYMNLTEDEFNKIGYKTFAENPTLLSELEKNSKSTMYINVRDHVFKSNSWELNDNFIINMNKYLTNKINNNELVTNKQLNYLIIQDELVQKLEGKGAFKELKKEPDNDNQVFLSKAINLNESQQKWLLEKDLNNFIGIANLSSDNIDFILDKDPNKLLEVVDRYAKNYIKNHINEDKLIEVIERNWEFGLKFIDKFQMKEQEDLVYITLDNMKEQVKDIDEQNKIIKNNPILQELEIEEELIKEQSKKIKPK